MDHVVFNPGALRVLLEGENGPVGIELTRRVVRVHGAAVRGCPVRTGRLRSSLRWSISRDAKGLVGLVGTDVDYALFVHEPTRPHRIYPRNGRVLAWNGSGGPAFAAYVDHPGTPGQPFLVNALREAF